MTKYAGKFRRWEPFELDLLHTLTAEGRTAAAIGKELGRTKYAVESMQRNTINGHSVPRMQPKAMAAAAIRVRQLQSTIERTKAEKRVDQELLRQYRLGLLALVRRAR